MERQIQFEKIKEILNETLSCKDEVIARYLYGSFLHGNYCDIDIGLLLDEHFRPSALYEVGIASELEKRTGMKNFDIRVLNNRPVRFLFSTLKNSVLIHCKDEGKRVKFESKVMMVYLDIKSISRVSRKNEEVKNGIG